MNDELRQLQVLQDDLPGWTQLETVFEALGRVLIVLDEQFRIVRASRTLDRLGCAGASFEALGEPVNRLFGGGLFGPGEPLRVALEQGRREEGRRAVLHCQENLRLVSLTAALLPVHVRGHCDPRARYLLVIRPAEEDDLILQSAVASHGLVTRAPAMLRILHLIESLHRSDATVLITGESGTGKEVVARALHAHSPRAEGPFVAVNCAALPGDLLESELFGHVKGAFTGAVRDRLGRFELAAGGSIFLDEIGDLPLHLQVKLLRVLQEMRFDRVGESQSRPMNARVIAATNVDLHEAIHEGRFRDDLYYRLRVVPIHIPPLRDRPEDVAPIAQHMLARIGRREGRALRISPDTLRLLERYPWPGNVRELENALEYAHALCQGQTIQIEDLPPEIQAAFPEALAAAGNPSPRVPAAPTPRPPLPPPVVPAGLTPPVVPAGPTPPAPAEVPPQPQADGSRPLATSVELPPDGNPAVRAGNPPHEDAARIRAALEETRWNRGKAARLLGVSRSTLWRRMRELGIG